MKRYLGELIKQKYDVDDLPLSDFTGEVIRAYEVCPFLKEVDSFLDVYCLLFTLCLCGVDWSGSIPGRS